MKTDNSFQQIEHSTHVGHIIYSFKWALEAGAVLFVNRYHGVLNIFLDEARFVAVLKTLSSRVKRIVEKNFQDFLSRYTQ